MWAHEDAELWLFSQNVWLKSEAESENDSSTGGVYSGKREIANGIYGWNRRGKCCRIVVHIVRKGKS